MKKVVITILTTILSTFNACFAQSLSDSTEVQNPNLAHTDTIATSQSDILARQAFLVNDSCTTSALNLTDFSEQKEPWVTPYALPFNWHNENPSWHRMWINTSVLSGAFVGTLLVLQVLPEDATTWNRKEITSVPLLKRWYRNVFKKGPEWDHDNVVFNYILHPYAGMSYFMSARSCGFGFWGSLLYSATVSTVGWEFGIEAFMERPSYQDLIITPIVGSVLGELGYRGKRAIVNNGYNLLGSNVLGHIVCFVIDPVNEFIDLFRDNPTRQYAQGRKMSATFSPRYNGFSLALNF